MTSKTMNAVLEVFRGLRIMCYYFNWIRGPTKEVLFFVSEKILFLNRRKKFWLEFLQDSITIMVQMINVLWYSTLYLSIINGYLMSSLAMLSELQLNLTMEVKSHKSNHYFYFSLHHNPNHVVQLLKQNAVLLFFFPISHFYLKPFHRHKYFSNISLHYYLRFFKWVKYKFE